MPKRKTRDLSGPQQIARIPPFRPGKWVKVTHIEVGEPSSDLSGKVRQVKSLTCSFTAPEQKRVLWRVHFRDDRCLLIRFIERIATPDEIKIETRRVGVIDFKEDRK